MGLAIRRDSIGRAEKEDGMQFGLIDRAVDLGKEKDAVPHGNSMLGFPVVPLAVAYPVAGRSGIGLGVIKFRLFDAEHLQFESLIDNPETRISAFLIFEELELKGPFFGGYFRESQFLGFDRVELRRFGISGHYGPKSAVLEIDLQEFYPRARNLHLIKTFDFRVFFGVIIKPGL